MIEQQLGEVRIYDIEAGAGEERRLELWYRGEQAGYAVYQPAERNYYPEYEGPFFRPDTGDGVILLKALSIDAPFRQTPVLLAALAYLRALEQPVYCEFEHPRLRALFHRRFMA